MSSIKIWPVEEMVREDEFTDRVELLREMEQWIVAIQRMAAPSTALIAPRRIGKTVFLDRLVNTVFFKPEYKVAPFYFKMTREKRTLRKFLLEYATTFYRQYLAYCEQDSVLFRNTNIDLEQLLNQKADSAAGRLALERVAIFLERYNRGNDETALHHWDSFIREPEELASFTDTRVAVIIDEFQDMQLCIYDMPEELMDSKDRSFGQGAIRLANTYDRQAQSRKAPMLVSGSAVTMVFKTVMGGPLGGRFGFKYLKPFSVPDGATLLHTSLKYYTIPELTISPAMAMYASAQVGGHPYYLYCLAVSECEGKNFKNEQAINRVIRYEIENGKIYGFWRTHFDNNRDLINQDDDTELGKKIIYYFTLYNNQPVDTKAIADKLGVPKKAVAKKIEKLYAADLVYRSAEKFYSFNDICLMRFIKFVYEQDLEGVDEVDLSQQGLINTMKGKFLEIVAEVSMLKFNYEKLPAAWFAAGTDKGEHEETVEVPLFQYVRTQIVKASARPAYQIDVLGREAAEDRVWLCEYKYTRQAMGIAQVEKLEAAAEVFRQQQDEEGLPVPGIRFWLISTGGFTEEVRELVHSRKDMYASDDDGINNIFKAFGGNYSIPLFAENDREY
ncbi:MAG: hypothetical protein Q3M24_02460 [Candidatus Electrothrix aestuarii]|uniref:ATPase domain protein, prokaryote domain protein n=1 Tax=Candidatus Electrothrix aestuarii TaxID=3062594 RepID=A0AAU8LXP3_9BACT|nr:hypothetical protein [Candidatus Electrothrix aestuarii]